MQEGTLLVCRKSKEIRIDPKQGLKTTYITTDDIPKRLKELKCKRSVESPWFSNGKIKFKQRDYPRIKEIRGWRDLANIE